jgi:hypothetical protein
VQLLFVQKNSENVSLESDAFDWNTSDAFASIICANFADFPIGCQSITYADVAPLVNWNANDSNHRPV